MNPDGSGTLTGEWGQGKKVRKTTIRYEMFPLVDVEAEGLIEALQSDAHAKGRPVKNVTALLGSKQ